MRRRMVVVKWSMLVKGGNVGTNIWMAVVVWGGDAEGCGQMDSVGEGWQCRDKRVDEVRHMKSFLLLFLFCFCFLFVFVRNAVVAFHCSVLDVC